MARAEPSPWGEKIRKLRLEKGWNQAELAARAGRLNTVTISQIERGANTTTDTLQRIAEALGVSLVDLFVDTAMGEADINKIVRQVIFSLQRDYERCMEEVVKRVWAAVENLSPKGRSTPRAQDR
jgi:transcriptional regulator with XRE-family HTH domain